MLIENFLGRSAGTSGEAPAPSGDSLFQISERVLITGNDVSNVEVFRYVSINNLLLAKVAVLLATPRTNGILSFQVKKDGTNIGSPIIIDNATPQFNKLVGLSSSLNVDSVLTVELTSTGFSQVNSANIFVEVQKNG